MNGIKTVLLAAAAFVLLGIGDGPGLAAETVQARVAANVRTAPSAEAERVSVLRAGQSVRILSESGDGEWVRISDLWGNELGYVAARLLNRQGVPPAAGNSDPGSSIFARAVQSGSIDEAHDENRRAAEDAERRRLEAWHAKVARMEAERAERDRIAQLEQDAFEREQAELRAWALQSEDYSGSRGDALDNLAARMAGHLQTMQNDLARQQAQQAWEQQQAELARERRQREEQQSRQQPGQTPYADAPNSRTGNTGSYTGPAYRPAPGGGSVGGARTPSQPSRTTARSNQCWYTPEPPQPTCVAETVSWDDGRFVIRSRNVCNKRIVVRACGYRADDDEYCGMSGIGPGGTWSHLVGKSLNPTGGYRTEWAGSVDPVEDWTCMSRSG